MADLLSGRLGRRLDERHGADDLAGRAEAALERVAADEGIDHRMVAQALDRRHACAVERVHERDARQRGCAVDEHGAGAAMAFAAGDLGAGQREVVPQRLGERRSDLRRDVVAVTVDRELHQAAVTASMSAM